MDWLGSGRRRAAKDDSSVFRTTGRTEPPSLRQEDFGNGGGGGLGEWVGNQKVVFRYVEFEIPIRCQIGSSKLVWSFEGRTRLLILI